MSDYDELAWHYHLIYDDWEAAIGRQAGSLDRVVGAVLGEGPRSILDVSCGIGTQALGLARLGHRVHGTDASRVAVERARREAARMGLAATFGVADMRAVDAEVAGVFDVVLSADNSIAHLPTDDDLEGAFRAMRARLRPGGVVVVTLRDYDVLPAERPRTSTPRVFDSADGRRVVLHLHDWDPDAPTCATTILITRQSDDGWRTLGWSTQQRAWLRAEVDRALIAAGLGDRRWWTPDESGFFQPLVTARSTGRDAP